MAWMLRELFDYREASQEQRRDLVTRLYNFVRDNPSLMTKSIRTLERSKNRLRVKAQNYK